MPINNSMNTIKTIQKHKIINFSNLLITISCAKMPFSHSITQFSYPLKNTPAKRYLLFRRICMKKKEKKNILNLTEFRTNNKILTTTLRINKFWISFYAIWSKSLSHINRKKNNRNNLIKRIKWMSMSTFCITI